MYKDRDKTYNGSYLNRLNEELSGQRELDPYFFTSSLSEDASYEIPYDKILEDDDSDETLYDEDDQSGAILGDEPDETDEGAEK